MHLNNYTSAKINYFVIFVNNEVSILHFTIFSYKLRILNIESFFFSPLIDELHVNTPFLTDPYHIARPIHLPDVGLHTLIHLPHQINSPLYFVVYKENINSSSSSFHLSHFRSSPSPFSLRRWLQIPAGFTSDFSGTVIQPTSSLAKFPRFSISWSFFPQLIFSMYCCLGF